MKKIIICGLCIFFNVDQLQAKPATSLDITLQLLQEACTPYIAEARYSLEAADLALYCLTTGESVALQAANGAQERHYVKTIVSQWIEAIQPQLAFK